MARWIRYDDKIVHHTPIGDIRSGALHSERSGQTKTFYSFDFPDWVNIVALTPDSQIVLIKQFRYGTAQEELEIPGGAINPGESPVAAGCRELREETGYVGTNAQLIGSVCPNPAIQSNLCHTVLVTDVEKTSDLELDEMEDIDCLTVSEQSLWNMIHQNQIQHGLVLNALFFYFNFLNR
ncbi:MAG: NUDIX hydrolase [Desulfobulbaceae bacterium]|nr:MAG: NUDIX hydrolase [Desulfobulbaceae bacterium]